jgi:hypothetical protein
MVGSAVQLGNLASGMHVLRFRLPGCETKDVLVVIDPQSREHSMRVSLEPAMDEEADSPFVYDSY